MKRRSSKTSEKSKAPTTWNTILLRWATNIQTKMNDTQERSLRRALLKEDSLIWLNENFWLSSSLFTLAHKVLPLRRSIAPVQLPTKILKQSTNQRNEDRQNNSTSVNLCIASTVCVRVCVVCACACSVHVINTNRNRFVERCLQITTHNQICVR